MRKTVDKIKGIYPNQYLGDEAYQLASLRFAPEMSSVIYDVKRALKKGIKPERPPNSSAHVYFLKDEDAKPIAVFKTERYLQEFTAYRLDHKHFANVPPTVITTLESTFWNGRRTGSLQYYVEDSLPAVRLSREAHKKFSESSVHRIAALDIRCLNGDRHTSNLLVQNETELIPIDHEFILQNKPYIAGMTWIYWDQAKNPFTEEEADYILSLDLEADRNILLQEIGLEEEIANNYFISASLLKKGVVRKICPERLGLFLRKKGYKDPNPTVFEQLLDRLKNYTTTSWTFFTFHVYEEIEKILDEYAPGE